MHPTPPAPHMHRCRYRLFSVFTTIPTATIKMLANRELLSFDQLDGYGDADESSSQPRQEYEGSGTHHHHPADFLDNEPPPHLQQGNGGPRDAAAMQADGERMAEQQRAAVQWGGVAGVASGAMHGTGSGGSRAAASASASGVAAATSRRRPLATAGTSAQRPRGCGLMLFTDRVVITTCSYATAMRCLDKQLPVYAQSAQLSSACLAPLLRQGI